MLKFINLVMFWLAHTGVQYRKAGRINVLYITVRVCLDRPHLPVQWYLSSLHLFRQRAVVESVRCLNYLSLSTIKPRIFVWYLTSHFSVPRWNLWSQISSGWMGIISVFNPFIWIRHVLHHVFTEFRFYWIFSQREACVSADTRIWESSAYLN